MPWIKRNKSKKIVAMYGAKQYAKQVFLPDDNQEVMAFRNKRYSQDDTELKIRARARKLAIDSLKKDGELPVDYKDATLDSIKAR